MKSFVNISKNVAVMGLAVLASISLTNCGPRGNKPNIEVIQDMMESPAIKAQEYDESSPFHSGMRVPPEHTVPVGFQPYKYGTDVEAAAKNLKNPIAGAVDEETLLVGQKYYTTNCAVCHGDKGEGGVVAQMPATSKMALKPPTLLSDKVKGWPDGHLYHVIVMGQGVMGPYASHILPKYRWQVVNYIRFLQKRDGK
jgi:mono/diheme cytochrome c family protein